jgi:hypothetical protein
LKLFELSTDANNFKNLVPVHKDSWDIINSTNLKRMSDNWTPIELEFIGKGKKGDCPSLIPHLPVLSDRGINVLNELIEDSIEYLPFICPGKDKFWGVNVLKAVDCIDYDNADVVRFQSSGRIMRFKKFAFKKDMLEGIKIFKTPDYPSVVFVSENFVEKVKEAGLKGFEFVEV